MMARSHVVVGLSAWAVAAPLLRLPPLDPAYLALAAIGSLLPDVDHPKSWIGLRLRPMSTMLGVALRHRGATHSAVAVLGLVLLLQAGYHPGAVAATGAAFPPRDPGGEAPHRPTPRHPGTFFPGPGNSSA